MITAAEARKLAGPTVQEKVEALLVAVEEAAKNKKRSLKTGWEYKEDQDLWISGGYGGNGGTAEWKEAVKILKDLGYKVKFYYMEQSIAVDMYTLVEW